MTDGILFVLPWGLHHIGGVNQVVLNLYDEMERRGDGRPTILVDDWTVRLPRRTDVDGRRVVRMRLRAPIGRTSVVRNLLAFLLWFPLEALALRRLLAREAIGVVNLHYPTLGAFPFVALRRLGLTDAPVILSVHGLDVREPAGEVGLAARLLRWLFRRADAVVACSNGLAADVRAFEPGCAARLHTVHNGIDLQRLEADGAATGALPPELAGRRYVVNVGTFEHKKGQDLLVQAFARVREAEPDLVLAMVGRSAGATADVAAAVERLGLASHVVMLTDLPHERVLPILREAELFVLSSRAEGFAVALLEAAAFSLPIVATDVCGVSELIEDGATGLLVPPEDPSALADGMRRLLADAAARRRLGRALHARVARGFSWGAAHDGYRRIVDGLARGPA